MDERSQQLSPPPTVEVASTSLAVPRAGHLFLWLVRLAAVATLVVFAFAGWRLVREGDSSLGWSEVGRGKVWYVAGVSPAGPATNLLASGDRLIALDDDASIATVGTGPYRRALRGGHSYRLRIARGEEQRELTLIKGPTDGVLLTRVSWFVVSLIWCGIGLFMGFIRPERQMARLAFLAACGVGFVFIQNVVQLGYTWAPAHMVLGYHFFYRFPGGAPPGAMWTALLWLLYGLCVLPFVIGHTSNWLHYSEGPAAHTRWMAEHAALMTTRQMTGMIIFDLALLAAVAVIARNYWLLRQPDQRRRIRWVVYCSLLGLAPQFWLVAVSVARLTGRLVDVPLYALFVNASTCAIPISVAYAVIRHRLFDIKVVIRRGFQYLFARRILQLLLAVPIGALAYTVFANRHLTITQLLTENLTYVYSIGMLGVSLRFRNPMRLWLDRRFFREQYDSERVLIGLVDQLARAESIGDLSRLAHTQIDLALHPKTMHLCHLESEASFFTPSAALCALLDQSADPVETAVADLPVADSRDLAKFGWQLIVPVRRSDGGLVGVLLLGDKKSEEPYSAHDQRLLQAIAKQIAIMWENLRLQDQIGEEQRIRHTVLAKFDRELVRLLKECPGCGVCYDSEAEYCDRDGLPLTLPLPVERTIEHRYRLDQLIGKGGMGAVYEAQDLRLERRVAVKIMIGRTFGDEQALRRFQREARAVARLSHTNIVSVHDCGRLAGEGAYLVMERIWGATLRAELNRLVVLTPDVAAKWFDQLLAGVGAAHEQGIVHRDLKPENIIGHWQSADSLAVKILDFGLAKFRPVDAAATASLTVGGAIMGTMGYMSPEQLLGHAVNERTDLFAAGVMLAEVLTGARPFSGSSYAELLRAVTSDIYHLPGSSSAIRALDDLVQRCLAKNPADRVASAAALRDELIPLLRACPPLSMSMLPPAGSPSASVL